MHVHLPDITIVPPTDAADPSIVERPIVRHGGLMTTDATTTPTRGGLKGFLDRGGFWPLLVVVVVYLGFYLAAGWVVGLLDNDGYKDADLLSSVGAVFFQITAGLIVGSIILTIFTSWMGWNEEIFGRQPIYRSWWMWIAPVLVALPILGRVLDIDWGGPTVSVVLFTLATGLLIGYSEELLFRGVAVKMLRAGGHREFSVALVSSLLFGMSHGINLFSGQEFKVVGPTMVYTVAFGVLMYLTMRATGFIIFAMVLHALTDPTGFLASGGVDKLPGEGGTSALADLVGLVTLVLVFVGIVLLLCIRGKVGEPKGGNSTAEA
jgi:membrane protease YdiL (CAAX protease family)